MLQVLTLITNYDSITYMKTIKQKVSDFIGNITAWFYHIANIRYTNHAVVDIIIDSLEKDEEIENIILRVERLEEWRQEYMLEKMREELKASIDEFLQMQNSKATKKSVKKTTKKLIKKTSKKSKK